MQFVAFFELHNCVRRSRRIPHKRKTKPTAGELEAKAQNILPTYDCLKKRTKTKK